MSETTERNGVIEWIDLSRHGLVMAVCVAGEARLLGVAGSPADADREALKRLGFARVGEELWVREGDRVDFAPFLDAFPQASRAEVPRDDFLARNVIQLPDPGASAKADSKERARRREEAAAERKAKLQALLARSTRLGSNHLGQEVWTSEGDVRFALKREKNGDFNLMPEGAREGLNPGLFLRATTPQAADTAADGVVASMAAGETLRMDGFRALAGALLGDGSPMAADDPRLAMVDGWVEAAAARWVARRAGQSSREMFAGAQRLHEARAYRMELIRAGLIRPGLTLPAAVSMQRALGGEADLRGREVRAVGHPALGAFVAEGAKVRASAPDVEVLQSVLAAARRASAADPAEGDEAPFAVVAAPVGGVAAEPVELDGVRCARADVAEAVRLLEGRSDEGRMVVALPRGGDGEVEAFHRWAARRWAVEGAAALAGSVAGAPPGEGSADDTLLLCFGVRRPERLDEPPEVAMRVDWAGDHAALWTWTSVVNVNRAKIANHYAPDAGARDEEEERDGPEANKFQAPYVSLSRLGVATTMVPRNLEEATREGLSRVARAHPDHDTWVCNELGMTREEAGGRNGEPGRFSPEQLDAIAMVLHAWERRRAALVADMTGLGKGRTMAGVALAAIRQGRKVMFLTERPLGFGEVARDFQDIGGWDELSPFVLNAGVDIKDDSAPDVPGQEKPSLLVGADRRVVAAMAEEGAWPEGANIVFATYSQFNRPGEPLPEKKRGKKKPAVAAPEPEGDAAPAIEQELVREGEVPDAARLFGPDEDGAEAEAEAAPGEEAPAPGDDPEADAEEERAEGSRIPEGVSPKSWWLRHAIDEDVVLILDESHNAASTTSHSGANIAAAVRRAGDVLYSSATWAKGARNLAIYSRLFPRDFDTSNLAEVINKGGDDMNAILTSMLVRDGVMIARQHDLSQCTFEAAFDDAHRARNNDYLSRLAPVLSEMAFMSGDIERRLNTINAAKTRELMARYRGNEERVKGAMRRLGLRTVAFGSPLYQLTKLCTASLLIDETVRGCIADLEAGRKPVVFTENTVQGLLSDLMEEQGEGGRVPDFRDLLKRTVAQLCKVKKSSKGRDEVVEDPFKPSRAERLADRLAAAVRARMSETLLADPDPDEPYPAELGPDGQPLDELVRSPWKGELYALLREEGEEMARREGIVAGGRREAWMADMQAAVEEVRELVAALHPVRSDNVEVLRGLPSYLPPTPARYRRRIEAMIDRLPDLPASAIDAVREGVEAEGMRRFERGEIERPWRMGEITGRALEVRDGRVVRRERMSKFEVRNAFNNGEMDGLVINAAGATSVSLHAGRRMKDKRQRVMYMLQQHGDIMKFVQAIGRIYRFDQVVGPVIRTPMLDMPAHERLLAIQNVKLRRLSANMQSSKEHPAAYENIADLMNPVGDKVVLAYAEDHPEIVRRMAMDPNELRRDEEAAAERRGDGQRDAESKDNDYIAHRFLARLILLPPELQVRVLEELRTLYAATIQELADKGENPLETRVVKGDVTVSSESVYIDNSDPESDSVFNDPVLLRKVSVEHHEDPLRSRDIGPLLDAGMADYAMQGLNHLRDHLARNRDRHVADILLPGQTEAQAMAGGGWAAKAIERFDQLVAALGRCMPGMVVTLDHEGLKSDALILSVHPPREDDPDEGRGRRRHGAEFSASGYKVSLAVPGTFKVVQRRLSTLLSEPGFQFVGSIEGEVDGLPAVDVGQVMAAFDHALEGQRVDRRVMLAGNLWGAMQAMHDHKLGYPVSYVTEDGRRELAVMVSKRSEALDFLPIRMSGPERGTEMAADLLIAGKAKLSMVRSVGAARDLNARKGKPLQVTYAKKAKWVKFSFPSPRDERHGWIRQVPAVQEMLARLGEPDPATKDGHWLEARDCIVVRFAGKDAAGTEEAKREVKAVMSVLLDAGMAMFAPASCRDDIREWRQTRGYAPQEADPAFEEGQAPEEDDPVARLVA